MTRERSGLRTFLIVWFGQLVSQVGGTMTGFALVIHVYQTTGSVTRLGVVMLSVSLPAVLLAPFAGVAVDRHDRRLVMLLADTVAAASTLAMALLFFFGSLEYWQILAAGALSSAAGAFQEPAYRASLPTLVRKEHLGRANGLVEMGPAIGTLVAPAIAGALLLLAGLGTVLVVDVATFLVAVATLAAVRFPSVVSGEAESASAIREALAGFRYLRERGGLLGLLWVYAGLNLVLTLSNVLWVPVFLAFANEAAIGALFSTVGVAMLLGSVVMSVWGGPKRRVAGIMLFLSVGGVGLAIAGLRPSIWISGAGAVLLMLTVPIVNGTSQALWQTKVDLPIQGRVFSTRRMVAQIATPIAFLSAGPLADGIFEPLLMEDGALAGSLGTVFGTGPGRGSALLITCTGLGVIVLAAVGWALPKIRNLETDIPDAIPDSVVGV